MLRVLPAVLTGLGVVWVALILTAPLVPREAALVYAFAAGVCHQRPERSFHLAGMPLPVCARCAGLYASGAAAAVGAMLTRLRRAAPAGHAARAVAGSETRTARVAFAAAAAPTAITLAAEWLGLASPSNLVRAVASLPLGGAAGWLFVRMLLIEAGRTKAIGERVARERSARGAVHESPRLKQ